MKLKSILMLVALLSSSYLWAHTALEYSVPQNGATIRDTQKQIELGFNQPTKLVKFELLSPENETIDTVFKPSLEDHQIYVIKMDKVLTPGLHTVFWTLLGADGHKVEGYLQFTVEPLSD